MSERRFSNERATPRGFPDVPDVQSTTCVPDDGLCETDAECGDGNRCDNAGACIPLVCADFNSDEQGCIDNASCSPVYGSNNCTPTDGSASCTVASATCVCEAPFFYAACIDAP